jgi:ABC-type transport system substrate-binding protein
VSAVVRSGVVRVRRSGRARRAAAWLGAVLAACLLITGCTPPNLPPPIAPTGGTSVPSTPPAPGTLIVGLDGTTGSITGFNPYAVADYSPTSQAVASLVLPSAFVMASDGTVGSDSDVVDWVAVTSLAPFTVTYLLDRKASWSDGTPITAEDFSYLRDQLLVQPGTVGSAGYRLISAIRSRDAGKTVEVEFAEPFPEWRSLFSPLLPSHLLKDSPGGWSSALDGDLPLSANRYRMTSYDAVTGQVTLARNDKYWGAPPGPSAVLLRLGRPAELLAAFNRGDVQALWFAPDATTAQDIADQVPDDQRTSVATPSSVQLVMNTLSGPTADMNVRTAIAAGLKPDELSAELTAGWTDGARQVASQVALPVDTAGQAPSVITDDPSAAEADLNAAGYTRNGLYVARQGQVLRLTLGYPSGQPRTAATVRAIQEQLGAVGIEVDLKPDAAPDLIENNVATGDLDLALVNLPRGSVDSAAAATAFGCPRTDPLGIGSVVTPTPGPTGTTATPTTPAAGDAAAVRTGNLSGYCQSATQVQLVEALTGTASASAADPQLWSDLPVLPLIRPLSIFAVSPALRSVLNGDHPGWAWTGPLSGLANWPSS